jgi:hypothetical protein
LRYFNTRPPVISSHPQSIVAFPGETRSLTVTATHHCLLPNPGHP